MKIHPRSVALVALLTSVFLTGLPAHAARCDTDVVPAATLLFPYFEVDLQNPDSRTTLVAITNRDEEPALVNVVLWTDWAVPIVPGLLGWLRHPDPESPGHLRARAAAGNGQGCFASRRALGCPCLLSGLQRHGGPGAGAGLRGSRTQPRRDYEAPRPAHR